jgi:outer membrane lipoprotein LolB
VKVAPGPGRPAPHWTALLAAAALAACATPQAGSEAVVLSGRLSVVVAAQPPDEPARSLSAQFELAGNAERGRLNVSTPLGTRLAEARWSPGEATLVEASGSKTAYADLDALTRAMLGETLPVAAWFDWLAGRPSPAAASVASTAPGAPGFRQLGWQVDLARFDDGLVVARRDAPPAVTVRAKLDAQP